MRGRRGAPRLGLARVLAGVTSLSGTPTPATGTPGAESGS